MSEKFDQFLDDLSRNPTATSPAELDENTIRIMRALATSEQNMPDPDSHVRARVWQRTLASVPPRRVKTNWLSFAAALVVIGLVVMSASWLTKPHIISATAQSTATTQPTVATQQPAFLGYAGVAIYKDPMNPITGQFDGLLHAAEKHIWYANDHSLRDETYSVEDNQPLSIGNEEQMTFNAVSYSHPTGQLPGVYIPISIQLRKGENENIAYYSPLTEEINLIPYFVVSTISPVTSAFYDLAHRYGPIGSTLEEGEQALKNDWGSVQLVRNKTMLGREAYVLTLKDWLRGSGQSRKIDHVIAFVDQQTLIFLGDQEFDASGQLVSEWMFTSIEFNPQLDPKLFTLQAPRYVLQNLDPDIQPITLDRMDEQWPQIAKTASFAIFKPTGIPKQQTIEGVIYSTAGKPLQYDADRHILTAEYQIGSTPDLDILEGSPEMFNWTDPTYETVQIGSITGHYRDGYRRVLVFELDGTQIALITTSGNGFFTLPSDSNSGLSKDELIKIAESFIAVSQKL